MGVVCCRAEPIQGKENLTDSSKFGHLDTSSNSYSTGKHYALGNSIERSTWFSTQYNESGDEEFYTKSKLIGKYGQ